MARGGPGAFGGRDINKPIVWFGFCLVFLVGLADLRRPLSLRNLDLIALLSFAASLWFFNRGDIFTSVPLAYPPLLYVIARMAWIGTTARLKPSRPVWPVWVLVAAHGLSRGLSHRAERRDVERDRRRLRGRDRRRPDRPRGGAVRPHARAGEPEGVRPGRRRGRDPRARADERPLRGLERPRRHLRPGVVPRVRPRLRALRLDRQVGRPAGGALHVAGVRRPLHARPRARRVALRRAAARGDAAVRMGGVSLHAVRVELEHERRDPPRAAHLRVLLRRATGAERRLRRAGRLDEVRCARRRAALGDVPGVEHASRCALRRRLSRRLCARVLGAPARAERARRGAHVLGPHARLAARTRVAVLDLGLGAVPRAGHPGPPFPASVRQGARARRARSRLRSFHVGSRRSSWQRSPRR